MAAAAQNVMSGWGYVYVIKLERPLGTARHQAQYYCGWTRDMDNRITEHRAGRGAAFTRAAVEQGIPFTYVYFEHGYRKDERRIKSWNNIRKYLSSRTARAKGTFLG